MVRIVVRDAGDRPDRVGGEGGRRAAWGVPPWLLRLGISAWLLVGLGIFAWVLVLGFAEARTILMPLVFGAVIAVLVVPLVDRLEERGMSRSLGSLLAVLLVVGVVFLLVWMIVAGITSQAGDIGTQIDRAVRRLRGLVDDIAVDPALVEQLRESLSSGFSVFRDGIGARVVQGVSSAAGFAFGSIIGLVVLYYVLRDGPSLVAAAHRRFTERYREPAAEVGLRSASTIRRYFAGRSVVSLVDAVFIAGGAALLGVPLVAPIALLTFFGGFIPYLGAFVSGLFAVLLALASGGLNDALILLAVVLMTQNVIEPVVEARVIGASLGLHPLVVLVVTTLGGIVAGIAGLILAAPLTSIGVAVFGALRVVGFFDAGEEEGQVGAP